MPSSDRHSDTKDQLNVRVSRDAHKALAALQKLLGVSQAAVIELALRRMLKGTK